VDQNTIRRRAGLGADVAPTLTAGQRDTIGMRSEDELVLVPRESVVAFHQAYTIPKQEDDVRADELGNLLDFVQGDPIDGAPTIEEIIGGIKARIGALAPRKELAAEQPSRIARLSGAIQTEAREIEPGLRIKFLSELVDEVTRIVRAEIDQQVLDREQHINEMELAGVLSRDDEPEVVNEAQEIRGGVTSTVEFPSSMHTMLDQLHDLADHMAVPTAIEFLNGPSCDQIDPHERQRLATVVAHRLAGMIGG